MSKWNTVDLDAAYKKGATDNDDNDLLVEDEEGNNLIPEKVKVVTEKEPKDDVVVDDEDDSSNEDNKQQDGGSTEKKTTSTKEDASKKSRAQDRIRELVRKNKETEAKANARIEALERQLSTSTKDSLESQQDLIAGRIKDVKTALIKAQEEGKFEESTELMSTLSDLQTKKLVVDSHVEKAKEEPAKKAPAASTEDDFDDTEMLGWLARNKNWWQKDNLKTNLAVRLSKKLDKEGILTASDPEYYEELDERLKSLLGEDKAEEDNSQDTDEDLQSSSKEVVKTKKAPQTNSGTSRTPAVTKSKGGKITVKLNPDERAMAKRLNISELEWAKQKVRQEKAKDQHGYQIIFDENA